MHVSCRQLRVAKLSHVRLLIHIFTAASAAVSPAPPQSLKLETLQRHPLKGKMCCTRTLCLQSGHSGFSLTQSPMHVQQKTCPHVVALGSFMASKQSVHLRACRPIQRIASASSRSWCGPEATGVCVAFEILPARSAGWVAASASSRALLAEYEFGSRLTSTPPSSVALVPPAAAAAWPAGPAAAAEDVSNVSRACSQACTESWRTSRTPRTS